MIEILKSGKAKQKIVCACECEITFTNRDIHTNYPDRAVIYCPECRNALKVKRFELKEA